MLIVLNAIIIGLTLLIAYWWANQGLFSAIIHLVCVIVAGALALALWEPLTVGLLLRGSAFDHYAWGISLIGVFVIVLLVLRIATNRIVPANVDVPHWANLAFGFPVGAVSGVLTVGILLIGAGHVQSQREIMDFVGRARSERDGKVRDVGSLWLPCHEVAARFYDWLSVGAFSTSTPLRRYDPDLGAQAATLIRDSYQYGKGQVTLPPRGARVLGAWMCADCRPPQCAVRMRFDRPALDFSVQLTVSSSQARLISWADGTQQPHVSHPRRWSQEIKDKGVRTLEYDDISHVATSIPGREQAEITFEFEWNESRPPRFIQVKGTRFELPRVEALPRERYEAQLFAGRAAAAAAPAASTALAGGRALDDAVKVANDISPVSVSTNMMPGGMSHRDNFIYEGDAVFPKGGSGVISRQLRIKGIEEPPQQKIIQVDVSRNGPADLFGAVEQKAGAGATPRLVDASGHEYSPIGFIHVRPDDVQIRLDPGRGVPMDDLPRLPTAGGQQLRLIFRVTAGVTIVGFKLGDVTVGTCSVAVPED